MSSVSRWGERVHYLALVVKNATDSEVKIRKFILFLLLADALAIFLALLALFITEKFVFLIVRGRNRCWSLRRNPYCERHIDERLFTVDQALGAKHVLGDVSGSPMLDPVLSSMMAASGAGWFSFIIKRREEVGIGCCNPSIMKWT